MKKYIFGIFLFFIFGFLTIYAFNFFFFKEEYWIVNGSLGLAMVFLHFAGVVLCYYFFGISGLFAFVPIAIIVANIQVLKLVDVFGLTTALGNAAYSSTFLVSDVLAENYGKKEAKRAVMLGFFSLAFFTFIMYLTTFFIPNVEDFSDPHLKALFSLVPRMAFSGLVTYCVSQVFDIYLYLKIKKWLPRFLFVRNLSSIISQFLDTCLFSFLAFGLSFHWGPIQVEQLYSWSVIGQIVLVAYLFKGAMVIFSTPYLYIAKLMKDKNYFFDKN